MKVKYSSEDPIPRATHKVNGYSAITHDDAKSILGELLFERMLADKVKGIGPTPDTVYPWNVRDYLMIGDQEPAPPSEGRESRGE
jgi:hypothetical protein